MRPADSQRPTDVLLIALHKLSLSDENVRKTDPGLQAAAEMKASIASLGILSNLVVQAIDDTSDLYTVVAGGRRYKALAELAEEGQVPPDMPVPCRLVPANASPAEISLAENVVRAAMHPADQVEAFAALAGAGATAASIAARFGVAERTVEQRLRLGNVAPELLTAYRQDEIDLECLKAFAVTADPARQLTAWEQVSQQGYRPTAWQIKRLLTETRVPATTAIARFVGADAYEAAGGALDRDLFAAEHDAGVWFEDPRLLDKLAQKQLQDIALPLAQEWKWAEARLEVDWGTTARYGRVHPVPAEPTPEEAAERDKLLTRQDELANMDDEDWTEDLVTEAEDLERRLDELQENVDARAVYTDSDKAISGCIVTIGQDGSTQIIAGLVQRDDIPADTDASGDADNTDSTASRAGVSLPRLNTPERSADPAAEARKQAGIGIGLADDMRAIRTTIVKSRLSRDFTAAFDLFVFQAVRDVFTDGYNPSALEIAVRETSDRPHLRANDDSFTDHSPAEADLADRSHLSLDWMTLEDDHEAFALFRVLPDDAKQALFAACIARTVKGQLAFEHGARPELEATVARLDIDFAAEARPAEDMFWSRIKKSQMLDIARTTLGNEWATAHNKDKKAVLAEAMHHAFATEDNVPAGVTPEGRTAALAWTMPGFAAFDTGPAAADPEPAPDAASEPAPASEPDPQPEQDTAAAEPQPAVQTSSPTFRVASPPEPLPDPHPETVAAPIDTVSVPANGHDIGGDGLDIPAFLQRG